MNRVIILVTASVLWLLAGGGCAQEQPETVTAFVGSASKPAMEEAIKAFKEATGIQVYGNYGGSGTMLSQIELSKSGDLYIPGSPDYMVIAEKRGFIDTASAAKIAYLIPVIAVPSGNPKNIKSLDDLAKTGIEVGIGNPEAVCVGLYALEILDYNKLLPEVGRNIVVNAESCEKTAALISLKAVDAIIGWHVFHDWAPDSIDVVYFETGQLPRIAYIPAAITKFTRDRDSAARFLDFLVSPQGQAIFSRWGYIASESEARKFAPGAEIGGEYQLPETYRALLKS